MGNPSCFYCAVAATQADHLWPVSDRGSDAAANLVPACAPCNALKGDRILRPAPTVALIGPAGAGKTTLARALEHHTGWAYLSIDGYRGRGRSWDELIDDLELLTADDRPAITESVALPADYRTALIVRRAALVAVEVPESVRQQRLEERSDTVRDRRWDDTHLCHVVMDGAAEWTAARLDPLVELAVSRAAATYTQGGHVISGVVR